ncbi:hypothetical protein D3C74_432230 [compost metagenome]
MQIHAESRCLNGIQALRQQAGNDACQHIACSACAHSRMACDVYIGFPVRRRNDGMRSFQYEHYTVLLGISQCQTDPVTLHLRCG